MTDYERKAQAVLKQLGMTFRAVHKADRCPPWGHEKGCIHGDRYIVTIRRTSGRRSIRLDYWNSWHDAQNGVIELGAYDVLSTISSEASMPTNPDEVADELGPMPPSQAIAAAKFAARLQRFFTASELETLAEAVQ
jgi:hypothetical protein